MPVCDNRVANQTWVPMDRTTKNSIDRPVTLVLVYAAISSFILPVLATVLLLLLNRKSVVPELRNGWLSNTVLTVCLVLFTVLAGVQVVETVSGLLAV